MRITETQDVETVRPLLARWQEICHCDTFGLAVSVEGVLADLHARLACGEGALLLAWDGTAPVGFFAVCAAKSSLSDQRVAVEMFWFALPNHKFAGPRLFRAAQRWAQEHGCTHLLVSASRLASGLHDKVCAFCEKVGMKPFETMFIWEVQ